MVHSSGVGRAVSTGKAVIYHSVPDVIDTRTEVWVGGGGFRKKGLSSRLPSGSMRERGPYYLRCVFGWGSGITRKAYLHCTRHLLQCYIPENSTTEVICLYYC